MASDSKPSDNIPIFDAIATPAYPNWAQLKDTPLPKDLLPDEEEDRDLPEEGTLPDGLKKAGEPKEARKGETTKGGWKEYRDADGMVPGCWTDLFYDANIAAGKIYYFNEVSKESTRVKPTELLETEENETSTAK
jgi:hypothetical protein